mgnify:CR=1 FL=1
MKTLIAIATLAASQTAAADWVYREGKTSMRLQETGCINAAVIDGKTYAPCWVPYKGALIYVVYEDGDQGMLHITQFKNEPGI